MLNSSSIFIVTFLTTASLFTLFIIGLLIVRALGLKPKGWLERLRFRYYTARVEKVDQLLVANRWSEALAVLKECFYLDPIRYEEVLVDKVSNYHQALLSRLVIVAEKQSFHVGNLAILEDLLFMRVEIEREWFEAVANYRALQRKRIKKVPAWAMQEYQAKLIEIQDRLLTNQRTISSQLKAAIASCSNMPSKEEFLVH